MLHSTLCKSFPILCLYSKTLFVPKGPEFESAKGFSASNSKRSRISSSPPVLLRPLITIAVSLEVVR